MSYKVLARKWRPRSFKEMAGQGHVLKTLVNALDNERLHHAYLFTGTRGVGKTTIARILARCLNCEEGVSSEPCNQCSACTEIEEGRFMDLIEVDAASRTKVEDTRELLENVQYAPTRGRYKIYLIDEVHMLSGHSFNALLKTLEEPPPHVKFLLATTDPQKLPITVLSRCLQFNLKNLSPELVKEHLQFILEQEKIPFEDEALWQIGRAARGSVRDALTLLDQAISFCDGKITDSEISSFLGTINHSVIYGLVEALVANDAKALLSVINAAAEHSPDFNSLLEALLSYLHRIAIAQVVPDGLDNSEGDKKQVLDHSEAIPAENVQLYYQIALKGREDMPLAVDERSGIEMILLRMLAFTPQAGSLDAANTSQGKKMPSTESSAASVHPGEKKKPLKTIEVQENPRPELAPLEDKLIEKPEETIEMAPLLSDEKGSISLDGLNPDNWISLFYALQLSGITRSIAAQCLLTAVKDKHLKLSLDSSQRAVFSEEQQEKIELALSNYFGADITLDIVLETLDPDQETPAAYRARKQLERQKKAEETFKNDDNVKILVERFEGSIIPNSIEPLTPEDY
jgi:DNA polymerase-3 subunit gamma/tau